MLGGGSEQVLVGQRARLFIYRDGSHVRSIARVRVECGRKSPGSQIGRTLDGESE